MSIENPRQEAGTPRVPDLWWSPTHDDVITKRPPYVRGYAVTRSGETLGELPADAVKLGDVKALRELVDQQSLALDAARALHTTTYEDGEHQGGNCVDVIMREKANAHQIACENVDMQVRISSLIVERDEARRERDALRAGIRAVRDEWDAWESKSSTESLLRIFAILDRVPGREEPARKPDLPDVLAWLDRKTDQLEDNHADDSEQYKAFRLVHSVVQLAVHYPERWMNEIGARLKASDEEASDDQNAREHVEGLDRIAAEEPACSCFVTSESQWTTHYGATKPGSMREPNPECPAHGHVVEHQPPSAAERREKLRDAPTKWERCYREDCPILDDLHRGVGTPFVEHPVWEHQPAQDSEDWTEADRFADFRDAYDYARSHFTLAAHAHAKVDRREAYWIWKTIQHGLEQQERDRSAAPVAKETGEEADQ